MIVLAAILSLFLTAPAARDEPNISPGSGNETPPLCYDTNSCIPRRLPNDQPSPCVSYTKPPFADALIIDGEIFLPSDLRGARPGFNLNYPGPLIKIDLSEAGKKKMSEIRDHRRGELITFCFGNKTLSQAYFRGNFMPDTIEVGNNFTVDNVSLLASGIEKYANSEMASE